MTAVRSFPPLADRAARLLILGSMPGTRSLAAGEYYAHPHNAFWRILTDYLGIPLATPYRQRVRHLLEAGIAVWDVLESCNRPGSLDADIDAATLVPNDFAAFFARHARITHVCFNGATAERYFRQRVLSTLDAGSLTSVRLPSTSPAHAAMRYETKRARWHAALRAAL